MKKTIIYLLAATIMMSTLTACEDSSKDPKKESESKEEAATEKENPITDFLYSTLDDGTITIAYVGKDSSVVFPSEIDGVKVTSIGGLGLGAQNTVKSVTIPENVTTIEREAFEDCTSLSEVNLPDSLVRIESEAFRNCTNLKHIYLPPNCLNEAGDDIFTHSGLETVELAEGIEVLPWQIFYYTNLKEITMPSTLKEIGPSAFRSCKNLEKVILNEGLRVIDSSFSDCPKLTEIVIPSTVEELEETSFSESMNLKKVKFEGDAPKNFYDDFQRVVFKDILPQFTVYYHEGAEGFTSPEWYGYKTEIW